jgi:hypothetical protein
MRGVGRIAVAAKLEHPSSVAFGDTFSPTRGEGGTSVPTPQRAATNLDLLMP